MTRKKKVVERSLPGRYGKMDAAELDKEVEKFDREFIADNAKSLSPREKARERLARGKRGRPTIGKGAKRVLVTIEQDLLRRSDAYAKKRKMTRAALVARGLEAILADAK
jgi:hypothetical protein